MSLIWGFWMEFMRLTLVQFSDTVLHRDWAHLTRERRMQNKASSLRDQRPVQTINFCWSDERKRGAFKGKESGHQIEGRRELIFMARRSVSSSPWTWKVIHWTSVCVRAWEIEKKPLKRQSGFQVKLGSFCRCWLLLSNQECLRVRNSLDRIPRSRAAGTD